MKIYVTLLSIIYLLLTINCEANPWQEPVETYDLSCGRLGGRLVSSIAAEPKSFNPITARESSTSAITGNIFEALVTADPITLEIKGLLAKSWSHSANGLVWTFNLRDDVYFNDGTKFSSKDVVFTFNKLVFNPDIPSSARDIFLIDGKSFEVKALDDYTIKIVLPRVFAPFINILGSQSILPEHVYGAMVENGTFSTSMGLDSPLADIVGTGPFKLSEFLPGERIILNRNQHYWKKDECGESLPYLEQLVYLVMPNPGTSLLKFIEGELDYYGLTGEDLAYLAPLQEKRNFTIYNGGPSFASNFIIANQNTGVNPQTNKSFVAPYKQKWLRDSRFRRALAYAINRRSMIDIAFNGLGQEQYGPLTQVVRNFYNPDIEKYKFDPKKARDLLAQMGFVDEDDDGFLEDAEGRKLDLIFYTNANSPERVLLASIIRKDLEDVGIKIRFSALEFNNLVTKLTGSFDWELMLIGFGGGSLDPQLSKNVWHSSAGLHAWFPMQKQPSTEWEEEIDMIFTEGEKILDKQRRKKVYDKWQLIASQEQPLIYTVLPYTLYAVRERFGNVYPSVYGGAFGEIEYVYIKEKDV